MTPGTTTDQLLLASIAENIKRVHEYTKRDRQRFLDSKMVQDAVLRNLQTLAESTHRLSDQCSVKSKNASVAARDFWFLARRDDAVWQAPHKEEQRSLQPGSARGHPSQENYQGPKRPADTRRFGLDGAPGQDDRAKCTLASDRWFPECPGPRILVNRCGGRVEHGRTGPAWLVGSHRQDGAQRTRNRSSAIRSARE